MVVRQNAIQNIASQLEKLSVFILENKDSLTIGQWIALETLANDGWRVVDRRKAERAK